MVNNRVRQVSILKVGNFEHVITPAFGRGNYPNPNYRGTGQALCGVLNKGENLHEFLNRKTIHNVRNKEV